jgi:di/tricarboxylate transporter
LLISVNDTLASCHRSGSCPVPFFLLLGEGWTPAAAVTASVTLLCALWWISNTATTLMLLPVALAVLEQTEKKMQTPLLLGMAYAASIGVLGTPIGTPPNLIFMQVHLDQFGTTPSFPQWMTWGLPVVILLVSLAGFWLSRGVKLTAPVELPQVGNRISGLKLPIVR